MSSYLYIYIKKKDQPLQKVFWFSRNNPVHSALRRVLDIAYLGNADCQEWFAYRSQDLMPDDLNIDPDTLPTEEELITERGTHLTKDDLELVIKQLNEDINKAEALRQKERRNIDIQTIIYNALWHYFPERNVPTPPQPEQEEDGWDDYIDDLKRALCQIELLSYSRTSDVEYYCFID